MSRDIYAQTHVQRAETHVHPVEDICAKTYVQVAETHVHNEVRCMCIPSGEVRHMCITTRGGLDICDKNVEKAQVVGF